MPLPVLHCHAALLLQTPAIQAALERLQPMVLPPLLQLQLRVVPQAVCPLSPLALPVLHVFAAPPQTGQAAFALVQVAVVPPPDPIHPQWRVVLQALAASSAVTVPTVQAPPVALQMPLTTAQAAA